MAIDLSKCEIRTPAGDELPALYGVLSEYFPSDRLVFDEIVRKDGSYYTWTPYTLYRGDEVVGNVSLVPIRVWIESRITELVGVASVATAARRRRQGVAKFLLRHVLEITDRQRKPCILFTGIPEVYKSVGFQVIEQNYLAASPQRLDFDDHGLDRQLVERLTQEQLRQIAHIYAHRYTNYDGKVVRDAEYWKLYEMLFNPYARPRILLCRRRGDLVGYARVEVEEDRLLCSESCADQSDGDVAEALLRFVGDYASEAGSRCVTFALPPGHFAIRLLQARNTPLQPEPPGGEREIFMARPACGELTGPLTRLQWSLADKL